MPLIQTYPSGNLMSYLETFCVYLQIVKPVMYGNLENVPDHVHLQVLCEGDGV